MKWLKPAFNYTANFRWSDDLTREGQNISTQLRFGSNFTLTPAQLIEFIIKPKSQTKSRSSGRSGNQRSRTRNRNAPGPKAKDQKNDFCLGLKNFFDVADYITINISSPNTEGLRDFHDQKKLIDLIVTLNKIKKDYNCLLYTSPSPRDGLLSRMPSSA